MPVLDGYTSRGKLDVGYWIGEVQRGKKWRGEVANEASWTMWRRWYRGKWDADILPSNLYFKVMRTLIPRIYFRNPSVSLTPSKPGLENILLAKILERVDNKLINVLGVKDQMKAAVQNACMFGTGGLRLGYGAEYTPTPDMGDDGGYGGDVSDPDVGPRSYRKRVEYNDLVHANMPFILSAHPSQIVVPAGCSDIHSARWVCYVSHRASDDVKADTRYDATARRDLPDGTTASRFVPGVGLTDREYNNGIEIWEIRDKKTGMVFCICPALSGNANGASAGAALYQGDDDLQIAGRIPFYPVIFNNDDEYFWGISDSQIIAPQQVEKNETRTMIRSHRRISVIKLLVEIGAISDDEADKLTNGNANGVIKVKTLTGIKELTVPGIPQGLLESEALVDREVQEMLGLGTNQFGEYAPGSAERSATEASIVNQATMIRIDERRDVCADVLTDIITDMNVVLLNQWDGEMIVDVVGPLGEPIWIKAAPTALKSALYDIHVDPDSSLPQTKALREQKAVQMYGILRTNPLISPVELTRMLVNEMQGGDKYALLTNPLMNSNEDEPLTVEEAMNGFRALPRATMQSIQQQFAQAQPAQVIPPQLQS